MPQLVPRQLDVQCGVVLPDMGDRSGLGDGEGGHAVHVAAGDLLVLPAGTGHYLVSASTDFLLVGAYPDGQHWDVCREAADAATLARIAAVPLPDADPVGRRDGPLPHLWSENA